MARRKPLPDIPPHPVGAENWHVQRLKDGCWLKIGGSEGNRSYATGFMVATSYADPVTELRLCDRKGFTYEVM